MGDLRMTEPSISVPPPSIEQPRHIPSLDGLRALSILLVIVLHTLLRHSLYKFIPFPLRLLGNGALGVFIFFVISGYLITTLLLREQQATSAISLRSFYLRRAFRILPPLYAYLLFLAILGVTGHLPGMNLRELLTALTLTRNYAHNVGLWAMEHLWSLCIEEQFYLLWPSFARRLTLDRLERLALILVVACPVLRLIAAASHHYNYIFTFFHCDGLALGAILACQQLRKAYSPEPPAPATWKPFATLAAALFLTALPFAIPPGTSPAHLAGALQLSGISLLCYCVISAAIRHTGAPLLAIFRSRLFTFFGLISYCLYIANSYVVNSYDAFHGPIAIGNMPHYWVRAAIVTAATLAICLIARYAIELPAMSLRRYVLRRP